MADAEKPARKSRREALYDKTPRAKPAERKAEPTKPAADRSHAEMFKRHENERRDMHGRHRSEHRAIEEAAGSDTPQKKLSAHHRHRQEMDQMHEKHEKELIDKLAAMHAAGTPAGDAAQAAA
jgi:hypothetical protein